MHKTTTQEDWRGAAEAKKASEQTSGLTPHTSAHSETTKTNVKKLPETQIQAEERWKNGPFPTEYR